MTDLLVIIAVWTVLGTLAAVWEARGDRLTACRKASHLDVESIRAGVNSD